MVMTPLYIISRRFVYFIIKTLQEDTLAFSIQNFDEFIPRGSLSISIL